MCVKVLFYALLCFLYTKAEREKTFQGNTSYCGPRLTSVLHDYCKYFYGPGDFEFVDFNNHSALTDKCCAAPCSILYIVLNYCKTPKKEEIKKTFGDAEVELYESMKERNVTEMDQLNVATDALARNLKQDVNVRRKKHVRQRRRKRRKNQSKHTRKLEEKKKMLLARTVPQYIIGIADFQPNEPIIMANYL